MEFIALRKYVMYYDRVKMTQRRIGYPDFAYMQLAYSETMARANP